MANHLMVPKVSKFGYSILLFTLYGRYIEIGNVVAVFSYSLTLIDALDTLAIMGNQTEFQRVASLLLDTMDFDKDINVSVFETNIRG